MVSIPVVSVLLTFYNEERYLEESIYSILNQTFKDFELILVNDGSTDKSEEIVNSFKDDRIVYVKQENEGLSKALNAGLAIAKGYYIARMDADDIALPIRLQVQYDYMIEHPNCVVSGTDVEIIDMNGNYVFTKYNSLEFPKRMKNPYIHCPLQHPTVMFVREIAMKCDGYYEPIRQYFEDHMLWLKMKEHGELHSIARVLLQYRLRPNSISLKGFNEGLNVIKKKILQQGFAFDEQVEELAQIMRGRKPNMRERNSNYHLFLSRKYLMHTSEISKVWSNAAESLKGRIRIEPIFLMGAALVPFKFRRWIINNIKGN